MSRNVVFWSGGQDSTLVAIQLLRSGKYVKLISFDNSIVGGASQQNLEKLKRKQCLHKMTSEFGNKFDHQTFTWDGNLCITMQNRIWASLFPLMCKDNDNAYFGAIQTDTFWHYAHEFKELFNLTCKFDEKKVELHFPLEWYSKKMVIKELKKFGYLDFSIHSGDKL